MTLNAYATGRVEWFCRSNATRAVEQAECWRRA
jgi:hypothetical protein